MEFYRQIYKKDSKGKIRTTIISTDNGSLTQESGILGGNLVKHTSKSKPKNVGKINHTTPAEQARIEALAKIVKKLDEGYSNTIKEAEEKVFISPMLAKVFEKEESKIDWETAYVQPKLDGMRCLKEKNILKSRKNKVITTMNHIAEELSDIEDIFDGELYAHGLSFQENMKLIKKYTKGKSEKVIYHVYDIVLPDVQFIYRYALLKNIIKDVNNIEIVPTYKVNSKEDVDKYNAIFISEGYEGTMIRWGTEGYKINGRSSNLLKYKKFIDIAAEVIDVLPSDKNPTQGVVKCTYVNENNIASTFSCGMSFSHEERENILKNKDKYIGKKAEIRFFEYTDEGVPRFPVCVGFRLDK